MVIPCSCAATLKSLMVCVDEGEMPMARPPTVLTPMLLKKGIDPMSASPTWAEFMPPCRLNMLV